MGGQSRDRSNRAGHKNRSNPNSKPTTSSMAPPPPPPLNPAPNTTSGSNQPLSNPTSTPNSQSVPDIGDQVSAATRALFTAEQLEGLILKEMDFAYTDALNRLADHGYDELAALAAILRCGAHCLGALDDATANIVAHALPLLSGEASAVDDAKTVCGFADLRQLKEYALAGLITYLQRQRQELSRSDAIWCLYMSELNVKHALAMRVLPPPSITGPHPCNAACSLSAAEFMRAAMKQDPTGASFDASSFFSAFRSAYATPPPRTVSSDSQGKEMESAAAAVVTRPVAKRVQTAELVESVVKELETLSIDEQNAESVDRNGDTKTKTEMVQDLIKQVQDLEEQMKEREEWAQQKALQAAKKLSTDLKELRILRAEREENLQRKKEKQALEDETLKRLGELESALKKMSGQVDRANAVVRRLEMENAEIRAEMEAAKLSASESVKACQGLARKEKKRSKKLEACEQQKQKLLDDIAEHKARVAQAEQEYAEIKKGTREMEAKLKEDMKVKERNIALIEEERRSKEAAQLSSDRRVEAVHQKIETDSQRVKDDIRRLQEELLRLQIAAGLKLSSPSPNAFDAGNANSLKAPKESNRKMPAGFNRKEPSQMKKHYLQCVICENDEACVLLLPCAHQILCAGCNKKHEDLGQVGCPSCNIKIDERISVYCVSS